MDLISVVAKGLDLLGIGPRTSLAPRPWQHPAPASRKSSLRSVTIPLVMLSLLIPKYAMGQTSGRVVDLYTDRPIEGAIVTLGDDVAQTDENGMFDMNVEADRVAVRAHGYLKAEQILPGPQARHPRRRLSNRPLPEGPVQPGCRTPTGSVGPRRRGDAPAGCSSRPPALDQRSPRPPALGGRYSEQSPVGPARPRKSPAGCIRS